MQEERGTLLKVERNKLKQEEKGRVMKGKRIYYWMNVEEKRGLMMQKIGRVKNEDQSGERKSNEGKNGKSNKKRSEQRGQKEE